MLGCEAPQTPMRGRRAAARAGPTSEPTPKGREPLRGSRGGAAVAGGPTAPSSRPFSYLSPRSRRACLCGSGRAGR